MSGSQEEADIKRALELRFEGIRLRDASIIARAVDPSGYTKFDDWPPFHRQDARALEEEAAALKVLSGYTYQLKDLDVKVSGHTAWATMHLSYHGMIREQEFDITSRATVLFARTSAGWKIVHEHFSRFPEDAGMGPTKGLNSVVKGQVETEDRLASGILTLLREKGDMDAVTLTKELASSSDGYVDTPTVIAKCQELVQKGKLERVSEGYYFARYRVKQG